MSRTLLALMVTLLFTLGNVASSSADTETALSLSQANELALQNNIEYLKAGYDYQKASITAKQNSANSRDDDDDNITNLNQAQAKYVNEEQAEIAERVAKQNYDIAKEQLKLKVETDYYGVLEAESLLKIREASVQRAEEQLKLAEKKFKAGVIPKTELTQTDLSLASARNDLLNSQRELKTAQISFNQTLGVEVATTYKLLPLLKYEQVTLPSVQDLTAKALEQRIDLLKVKDDLAIAQLNYDLAVSYEAANTYNARKYKLDLEKAKLDVKQQEQMVKADVVAALYEVQKAEEAVQLLAKSLEQAKANHELAQRRYEIGVGTFTESLSASIDLANADLNYVQAVYNHSLAKQKLNTVTLVAG